MPETRLSLLPLVFLGGSVGRLFASADRLWLGFLGCGVVARLLADGVKLLRSVGAEQFDSVGVRASVEQTEARNARVIDERVECQAGVC